MNKKVFTSLVMCVCCMFLFLNDAISQELYTNYWKLKINFTNAPYVAHDCEDQYVAVSLVSSSQNTVIQPAYYEFDGDIDYDFKIYCAEAYWTGLLRITGKFYKYELCVACRYYDNTHLFYNRNAYAHQVTTMNINANGLCEEY